MKEREVTQIQLEQQSSFLRSFLDASPDLVFYRNEDKEFSGCNRAMELLTGKSEKQLIHLKPQDVYSEEAAAKVMETDEKVFRHNVSLTYEQWLDYPDGRKACFEIRKVPYYDRVGKRHGLMGFTVISPSVSAIRMRWNAPAGIKPPSSPPSAMNCAPR